MLRTLVASFLLHQRTNRGNQEEKQTWKETQEHQEIQAKKLFEKYGLFELKLAMHESKLPQRQDRWGTKNRTVRP